MNRALPRLLRTCLLATVVATVTVTSAAISKSAARDDAFKSGVFDPPHMAPDFELPGSDGSAVKLSRYRGKVVLLVFGFTHCIKVCPMTLANLAQASKQLGKSASDVQVLFVTVDPARDDAARLHDYLGNFNPTYLGITGAAAQLAELRRAYGVIAEREKPKSNEPGYQVHHSSSIYVIDRKGKLRLLVPFGKPPADIVHDLLLLLRS